MATDVPRYKFKYQEDLKDYLKKRRGVASNLRSEAAALISKAQTIDAELDVLESSLDKIEPITAPAPPKTNGV